MKIIKIERKEFDEVTTDEAYLPLRGIGKLMADLKREQYCLEQFIMNDEYITAARKNNLTEKWTKKLNDGQKRPRRNMVKSIMCEVQ